MTLDLSDSGGGDDQSLPKYDDDDGSDPSTDIYVEDGSRLDPDKVFDAAIAIIDEAGAIELTKAVDSIVDEYDGLVNEAGAVFLACRRLYNVCLSDEIGTSERPSIEIDNLNDNISSLTLEAKVSSPGSTFFFGDDGRGREVTIYDRSGEIALMLWDDEVELADDLRPDDSIKIVGGYADTYEGDLQVYLGDDGELKKRVDGEWVAVDENI